MGELLANLEWGDRPDGHRRRWSPDYLSRLQRVGGTCSRTLKDGMGKSAASSRTILGGSRNAGFMPTQLAIWILTVMAAMGAAVTWFPPRCNHPAGLAPSKPVGVVAIHDLSDRRWRFLRKYLVLRQDAQIASPQKIGHFNPMTWGAYFLNGELFIKRYAPRIWVFV
jgi:hypothetical protein